MEFRAYPEDGPDIVTSKMVTVIALSSREFGTGRQDKRELIASHDPSDLAVVWMGEWKADVFSFPIDQV